MTELSNRILALRSEGKSYNQIREITGASKGTISYYLGEGQVDKTKERQRKLRNTITEYIRTVKQNSVCADCKENYPYWVMEFDHLSDDKLFNIAAYKTYSANLDIVKAEIEKCDVVCANCHRNRTYLRGRNKEGALYEAHTDVSDFYGGLTERPR